MKGETDGKILKKQRGQPIGKRRAGVPESRVYRGVKKG